MSITQCQPHAAWDDDGRPLSLSEKEGIVPTQAIIPVVPGFAFAALPILWRTKIDIKTNIGLCALMGLGVPSGSFYPAPSVIDNQLFPSDESYRGIIN